MVMYPKVAYLFDAKSGVVNWWLFFSPLHLFTSVMYVFFFFVFLARLQRLREECYHIWRVILINENLVVTHRGYGRLITKDQNKEESQVRANNQEQ